MLLALALLMAIHSSAQTQRGRVVNRETAEPIYHATIYNAVTGENTFTDPEGYYVIPAKNNERLTFSQNSYHSVDTAANPAANMTIELTPLSVKLPAYTLHGLTQYQQDSLEMTSLYSKELNTKPVKVGFSNANGGGFTGLIGAPVKKMSRSYRQNKRFKENFNKDMQQRYIDSKYTPVLVNAITSLSGDSLAVFMNTYPMEYAFARTATDLEIKMWIRNNYKQYQRDGLARNSQKK